VTARTYPMYEGPPLDKEEILSVYVVLNGSLGMTPGKAAAMAFHCGWLVGYVMGTDPNMASWRSQGRRVVTRLAETEAVFERVKRECDGYVQRDEGMTEVDHGAEVAVVTVPYRRDMIPTVLTHKKVQLYRG
jgi:Peptidyl-tRNA hydrolase PTH2